MRIGIIDDHPLVRQGLISILSLEQKYEIVGEATNIKDGLDMIIKKQPEVTLIDLKLGDECGLGIVKEAKKMVKSKFVILTSSAKESDFIQAERVGVDGYILKEALPEELLYGIKLISRGRKYFDPGILKYTMMQNNDPIKQLTPREIEVLLSLGKGLSNKEISKKFFITEHTVKKHVSSILSKLGLSDRTQAAIFVYNSGLFNA